MKKITDLLFKLLPSKAVFAHCDIPCGIYDPHRMQLDAHTIIRMVSLILEINEMDPKKLTFQIARFTKVKEDHVEDLKHEVRVLWGDYFKEEHLKDYPDLHNLVFNTLKMASVVRQELNIDSAKQLLDYTQQIAEIFYKTKGLESIKIKTHYPTGGEIVVYR